MPVNPVPIKHIVLELRYAPTLAIYAKMDEIGLAFAEGFPDWERSALTLEIRNKRKHRRFFMSHHRAFYEAAGFSVEGPEFDWGKKLFDKLHHDLKFTKLLRLGVRQFVASRADEPFPKLVKLAVERLHPQSPELDKMVRGTIEDLAYVANVVTPDGWKYRLNVGPMERKQWFEVIHYEPNLFESKEDFEKYKASIPERMFFIDMDSYREDLAFVDVAATITSVRNVTSQVASDMLKFLSAKG